MGTIQITLQNYRGLISVAKFLSLFYKITVDCSVVSVVQNIALYEGARMANGNRIFYRIPSGFYEGIPSLIFFEVFGL